MRLIGRRAGEEWIPILGTPMTLLQLGSDSIIRDPKQLRPVSSTCQPQTLASAALGLSFIAFCVSASTGAAACKGSCPLYLGAN